MRFRFTLLLLFAVIIGGGYWYKTTATICPAPLSYRLGEIDESFNISTETARERLLAAEAVWEGKADRELFIYDEQSTFTVNFIYDERQEFADSEHNQRDDLDNKKSENETILKTVERLQADYNELTFNYQGQVAEYESRLNTYNETVSNYNDRGGAPADEYQALEDERRTLNRLLDELNQSADSLGTLAARINELSERGNSLVENYNHEVEDYNQQFGFSREFTQGDFEGDRINIYAFESERELIAVLAHEFGHALGIDHVEGTSSVMYYLLEDTQTAPTLTINDSQAFIGMCGTGNELSHRLRKSIRQVLAKFNF